VLLCVREQLRVGSGKTCSVFLCVREQLRVGSVQLRAISPMGLRPALVPTKGQQWEIITFVHKMRTINSCYM